MSGNLKKMIRLAISEKIMRIIKPGSRISWSGNYSDWETAKKATSGYEAALILQKVSAATLKVKKGEAAFERDSVLFYEQEYVWPLVGGLMWIAAQNEGRLRIMDFGGSLGSTYFQHKGLLDALKLVNWCVVEQEHFYEAGKNEFEDQSVRFYPDADHCLAENQIDVALLGSVLPYIEHPFALLEKMVALRIPFLIIDRTPFIDSDNDRLTVQKVPPQIYKASYPAWFFSYSSFLKFIKNRYEIIAEYPGADRATIPSSYKGLILKLR